MDFVIMQIISCSGMMWDTLHIARRIMWTDYLTGVFNDDLKDNWVISVFAIVRISWAR